MRAWLNPMRPRSRSVAALAGTAHAGQPLQPGLRVVDDLRGTTDASGHLLEATIAAVADAQVAAAVWRTKWWVHSQHAGSGAAVVQYLARYVFRTAISDHRIISADDDGVTAAGYIAEPDPALLPGHTLFDEAAQPVRKRHAARLDPDEGDLVEVGPLDDLVCDPGERSGNGLAVEEGLRVGRAARDVRRHLALLSGLAGPG